MRLRLVFRSGTSAQATETQTDVGSETYKETSKSNFFHHYTLRILLKQTSRSWETDLPGYNLKIRI